MIPVIGRLAPSPTGSQHIGNARTYLAAWLSARQQSGSIRLRIEDIDSPRTKPFAIQQTLDDLQWLGLYWDGPPVLQTTRMELYQSALDTLKARELVYPCTCTRKDIELAASAPHAEHELPPYPGTCARRSVADACSITDKPFAWRFRSSNSALSFEDGFAGQVVLNSVYGGDFVVWKNNNTPAYQLAVVVDDADMNITEIIRGDDLIPSTPRQIQLYQALGLSVPRFYHIPLVIGSDGHRLAKRHGDARICTLREQGLPTTTLLGFLAFSLGLQDHCEPIELSTLLQTFQIQSIPKSPLVLTADLLQKLILPEA